MVLALLTQAKKSTTIQAMKPAGRVSRIVLSLLVALSATLAACNGPPGQPPGLPATGQSQEEAELPSASSAGEVVSIEAPLPTPSTSTTPTPPATTFTTVTVSVLDVHFIDVGQGDSILIDYGQCEVLIDAGEKGTGADSYIRSFVDGPLEVVVATHPHADHIGGLVSVLNTYAIGAIWYNGESSTTSTYSQFLTAVQSEGADVHIARRGDKLDVGGLTFNVLSPVNLDGTTNNNSVVLSLTYGSIDFLFTGDAETEVEAGMLASGLITDVDVLKVGHHGSRSSSSPAFLAVARPETAVYSAGAGNSYGHPHQETVVALDSASARICGTDVHGTVVVSTDGTTYDVKAAKPPPPIRPAASPPPTTTTSPSPAIVPTTPSDPLAPTAINVKITRVFYDGIVPSVESDEYVEITNLGAEQVDLKGWVLKDIADGSPSFAFPTFTLQPGASVRVYTNEIHAEYGGFSFRYGRAVWNNSSPDTVALFDAQGKEASRKSY